MQYVGCCYQKSSPPPPPKFHGRGELNSFNLGSLEFLSYKSVRLAGTGNNFPCPSRIWCYSEDELDLISALHLLKDPKGKILCLLDMGTHINKCCQYQHWTRLLGKWLDVMKSARPGECFHLALHMLIHAYSRMYSSGKKMPPNHLEAC